MTPKISSLLSALLLTLPLAGSAWAEDASTRVAKAIPVEVPTGATPDQTNAAKLVYGLLSDSRYAYRPKPLDDGLSAEMYERYLESLDSSKQFFTAADIARFERWKLQFDDALKGGDLDPAYAMFATYRQRVDERVAFARELLKDDDAFDFSGDDRYVYDREDAPWAADNAELDALWRQSVRNDWLRLKMAGKAPAEIRKTLGRRYANMAKSVSELKGEDVFQIFLNSYTGVIDPHTSYLTPRSADNFNLSMSLSLEGIGAVLQKQEDVVAIREIVAGGPAGKSGLLNPGDRIVAVGQGANGPMEDVVGWRIDDVVAKIRGKKGSRVRLDVIPVALDLDSPPQRVVLVRDKVRLEDQAAKSKILTIPGSDGAPVQRIGVIELPGFYQDFEGRRRNNNDYASATRDVARLLGTMRDEKVDGVVLDLRNNGGGSLNEAIELTGLFIERGPVVQVRESGGRVVVNSDEGGSIVWGGPLAVLINRGSASASEIFAGAIQDYGRGLVIGETSFGKGTVQNLVDLDRWPANEKPRYGQVKLTIAQFFRVSGSSTQNRGVVPDITFPASVDASEFGESTYDNALPWTKISAVPHTRYGNFAPLLPQLEALHETRIATDKEFQWWSEDVARFKAKREETSVSLNEAERRAERDRDQARRNTRQEERKALGLALDPLADLDDDGLAAGERDIVEDTAREKLAEDRPDPLLRESAAILADAVRLLNADRQLSVQVLPTANQPGHWAD